jgi:hypothetical protein
VQAAQVAVVDQQPIVTIQVLLHQAKDMQAAQVARLIAVVAVVAKAA